MQPTLCSKCKKNVAVVFISRMNEKNEMVNEGLCLQCAAKLGLPQVEDMMKRMGITPEDLENLNSEMMQAFGGAEELDAVNDDGGEDDEESGKTATFPFLNRLFNNGSNPPAEQPRENGGNAGAQPTGRKKEQKRKFLDNYCINLSQRARDGKLDAVIGREQEIERVVQILNRRQKNNPCLIGEPGVGKTAIAEGLAQRIVSGDVPFKLRQKEVYLLDLTALVAGTQFRGQFEQRVKGLLSEVKAAGNVILFIDEIHTLVGAGGAEDGGDVGGIEQVDEHGGGQSDDHEVDHGVDALSQQTGQLVPLLDEAGLAAVGAAGDEEEQEQQCQNALQQRGVGQDAAVIGAEEGVLGDADGHQNDQIDDGGETGGTQTLPLLGGQLVGGVILQHKAQILRLADEGADELDGDPREHSGQHNGADAHEVPVLQHVNGGNVDAQRRTDGLVDTADQHVQVADEHVGGHTGVTGGVGQQNT